VPVNVSDLIALPFQWGSALRGRRFFHPIGVLAEGAIERLAPARYGLPIPSADVIARVSKAGGTPGPLPDFIGIALRVVPPQAVASPWDILLVSAGSGALARAVALRPSTSWTGQTLTSLMPFRYGERNWWLRARIVTDIDGLGLSLDSVRNGIQCGGIVVAIDQACGSADFEPLARLTLSNVIDAGQADDVSFDPVMNTAPGLALYPGWLAGLRARAYHRSRAGRAVYSPHPADPPDS
jgi:hypothetical protein